jgi:hypothetical protein
MYPPAELLGLSRISSGKDLSIYVFSQNINTYIRFNNQKSRMNFTFHGKSQITEGKAPFRCVEEKIAEASMKKEFYLLPV